jgi:RimJ/RimL family protein N-acetyltransferase
MTWTIEAVTTPSSSNVRMRSMVNIDDYSLVRLFDDSSDAVVQHISSLSDEDLYLRFGYLITPPLLKSYIETTLATVNTRTRADFWFGINRGSELVATLHVAILDDTAEFAFSTAEAHRGRKLGQLLFARGYQLVTEYSINRIYLCCLTQNKAIRHIARKFGLAVMTRGAESEGSVNIQYPISIKQVDKVKHSIVDKNLFM